MTKDKVFEPYELEDYTEDMLLLRFESKEAADLFRKKWLSISKSRCSWAELHPVGGKKKPRTGVYSKLKVANMHIITLEEVQAVPAAQILQFEVKYGLYENEDIADKITKKINEAKISIDTIDWE